MTTVKDHAVSVEGRWDAEADACEAAARRYASRGMDEEVAFFTAKAKDCRELAETCRVPHQLAAE